MGILTNASHERFAQNKAQGQRTGPAYTAAGFRATGNSAEVAGARLLQNVTVRDRIAELMAPGAEAAELSAERTLKEVTRLAFYDMTAILDSADGGSMPWMPANQGLLGYRPYPRRPLSAQLSATVCCAAGRFGHFGGVPG